jgi:hypothetical protein
VLPNLIVPGAGKSGTSSLHLYLDQHPDIAMTSAKEPHFFSDDERYASGPGFYDNLYQPGSATARYHGESSTGYLIFPNVPERISESAPHCRLIFVLRNPIDRAISHYRWLVGLGLEPRDFHTALDSDREEIPDPLNSRGGNYGYIYQEGCYGSAIDRFSGHFPASSMLLLRTEQLRVDPLDCLNRCCRFLGVEEFATIVEVSVNESQPLRHPRLRARLEGRLASSDSGSGRSRKLVKDVLGKRLTSGLRRAAVAALGTRPLPVPINVERTWLRDTYAAEVASLRDLDHSFRDAWLDDFPA